MDRIQTEILKDAIKKEYLVFRTQEKMVELLNGSIDAVEKVLAELIEFRSKVSGKNVLIDRSNMQNDIEKKKMKSFKTGEK